MRSSYLNGEMCAARWKQLIALAMRELSRQERAGYEKSRIGTDFSFPSNSIHCCETFQSDLKFPRNLQIVLNRQARLKGGLQYVDWRSVNNLSPPLPAWKSWAGKHWQPAQTFAGAGAGTEAFASPQSESSSASNAQVGTTEFSMAGSLPSTNGRALSRSRRLFSETLEISSCQSWDDLSESWLFESNQLLPSYGKARQNPSCLSLTNFAFLDWW